MANGRRFLHQFDPVTIKSAFEASARAEAKEAPIPKNRVRALLKKFTRKPEDPHWESFYADFLRHVNAALKEKADLDAAAAAPAADAAAPAAAPAAAAAAAAPAEAQEQQHQRQQQRERRPPLGRLPANINVAPLEPIPRLQKVLTRGKVEVWSLVPNSTSQVSWRRVCSSVLIPYFL